MAHGNGEGVGRIRGEDAVDPEELTHHVGHLNLVGCTEAHRSELDGPRRVFKDYGINAQGGQRGAARLAELECAVDVLVDEDPLDGDLVGSITFEELADARVDPRHALRERGPLDLDAAVHDTAHVGTTDVDDAEAGAERSRVEPQDAARPAPACDPRGSHGGPLDDRSATRGVRLEGTPRLGGISGQGKRPARRRRATKSGGFHRLYDIRNPHCAIPWDAPATLENIATCPPRIEAPLLAAHGALATAGVPEPALALGGSAARLVGHLTEDAALAIGVLIHEALRTSALAPSSLNAATREQLGESSLEVAEELSRLGDFGRGAQWSEARPLAGSQAETLRKMLLAIVSDPRLVVARIGLQLARLRAARDADEAQRASLAAETRAVFAPLANRLGVWQVKWELEDLAFRYLEPLEYRRIASALAERRADRERYIEAFCAALREALRGAGIEAEVYGRPKHLYSIHRKMQLKQLDFGRLFDIRAVRILCRTVPDCYAALGVVHSLHDYLPAEFADYIATPKGNLYRSIHTAVIGPQGRPVEVQIRTLEMHEHAELGVAAHWRYKEGGPRDADYERRIEGLRRLLEPGDHSAGADFIEKVRGGLFADRIYALTPLGRVVELARGATPLDFAYQVHTSLGHRCRGAKVNGRIVPLNYVLANGEVVEVIAGKQESPSRDWLVQDGYLASPRSRAKLRAWFRQRDSGENEAAGRVIAERELARIGAGAEVMAALITDLKATDAAQLHRWLGEGEISVTQLVQAATRRAAAAGLPSAASAATPAARKTSASRRLAASPIDVEGVGDLPITLARCCAPVRPQAIVGYATLGRGVTVHAATCRGLARMGTEHPERLLGVAWRLDSGAMLPVEVTILSLPRRGLVREISEALVAEGLRVAALRSHPEPGNATMKAVLQTEVRDLGQLERLLRSLAALPEVIWARRSA